MQTEANHHVRQIQLKTETLMCLTGEGLKGFLVSAWSRNSAYLLPCSHVFCECLLSQTWRGGLAKFTEDASGNLCSHPTMTKLNLELSL
eukprot:115973-Amphidinium_carterae.1